MSAKFITPSERAMKTGVSLFVAFCLTYFSVWQVGSDWIYVNGKLLHLDLHRRLAVLKSNCPEDEAEDQQQKENRNPGQTPLRNRMTTALECPCCYNDMRTDIFQCSNGHLICKTCLRRLKECPVCRTNYPKDPIRALFAEQMAQNLGNNS